MRSVKILVVSASLPPRPQSPWNSLTLTLSAGTGVLLCSCVPRIPICAALVPSSGSTVFTNTATGKAEPAWKSLQNKHSVLSELVCDPERSSQPFLPCAQITLLIINPRYSSGHSSAMTLVWSFHLWEYGLIFKLYFCLPPARLYIDKCQ